MSDGWRCAAASLRSHCDVCLLPCASVTVCMLALIGRAGGASPIRRGVMLSERADDGEVSDAEWDGEESDDIPARKHASRMAVKRARRLHDDGPSTVVSRQCFSKPQPALVVGQHDSGVAAALRLATDQQLMHELQRRLAVRPY